jgi:hypothetical protein
LQKHTNIIPESQEEEIILKDKFLTQSAPDIHKKLQKLVAEGSRDLDQFVHVATSVYYNSDLEKERKDLHKEKRKDKWQEALITALREAPPGQSPNPRTYFQCAQASHFRRECPQRKLPLGPDPFVGENIGSHTVPGSHGNQGQSHPPNFGPWGLPSRLLWPP